MKTLTPKQHSQWAYNGLTTTEFAVRIGVSTQQVRDMIVSGWFRKDTDPPECLDIRRVNAKQPTYRIHPKAVQRFYEERAS